MMQMLAMVYKYEIFCVLELEVTAIRAWLEMCDLQVEECDW